MDKIDGRTQRIDRNNNVEIYKYVAAFFFVNEKEQTSKQTKQLSK